MPSVGAEKTENKLSAWSITPPDGGLWGDYSVRMNTFNAQGQIEGDFCFLDENCAGGYGVDVGWYTAESIENGDPISAADQYIPFGSGVQIGSDCGANIVFSGEVSRGDTFEIVDETLGGYTWTGNTSPVDLKLEDISVTPPAGGLWGDYSVRMNTFNAEGQIEGDYCFLDENCAGGYGVDVGWYTAESIENGDPISAGSVIVIAGEMFQIGSDCGATLTIPDPLN